MEDCNDAACSGDDETITIVDSTGNVGQDTLIVQSNGFPIIAYYDPP